VSDAVRSVELPDIPVFRRGKVRDTFDLGDHLLMVATDRISAFDVVLPTPIPGKGIVLTQLSTFWFELTSGLIPNHLLSSDPFASHLMDGADLAEALAAAGESLRERSMLVRKAERIDVECVVRGYLAGSAWAEYRASGAVAGEPLPAGLLQADRLPAPLFTPAIKNDAGHDVNVSPRELAELVGEGLARRIEEISRDLYNVAADYALERGVILADTKFELGWVDGELTLIDEALTPDSSRFWDAATYAPGGDPPSFDKQYVRDWLTRSGWNKEPPGPELPPDVVAGTAARYLEAFERLTGRPLKRPAETTTKGRG
jgi:phosphoribosylaminoimidazole-succinocarboxamide synthase